MALDTAMISGYAMKAWGFIAWGLAGVFLILIALLFTKYYLTKKRFIYDVRIKQETPAGSGNIIEVATDKGGIFLDKKTGNRLFILQKLKVGLTPDNVPYYITGKGNKIVELYQTGLKSFRFLNMPKVVSNSPVALEYNIQDQDLAFAINVIDNAKMYEKTTMWQQAMPFIGMAFVFMLIIVSLYFIFKNFGTLKETAQAFTQAAAEFAKAKSGTVVVGG